MRGYSTDGDPGKYNGDGEDIDYIMVLVKTLPDGDSEDDVASIFTIILCLTTLHRCCTANIKV